MSCLITLNKLHDPNLREISGWGWTPLFRFNRCDLPYCGWVITFYDLPYLTFWKATRL